MKEVGAAAVGGAVAGALMTVGAGWSNVVMGAIGSGTGNAIEQGINIATGNQQDFDGKQLGVAATVGAGANVAGKFINKKFLTSAKKQLNAAKESKVMNLKEAQSKVIKENPYLKIKKGGDPQFKQKNLELQTKAHNEVEISQWQKDRNVQAAQNRYDKWSRQESKTYETCSDATQNITSQGINYLSNRDEK